MMGGFLTFVVTVAMKIFQSKIRVISWVGSTENSGMNKGFPVLKHFLKTLILEAVCRCLGENFLCNYFANLMKVEIATLLIDIELTNGGGAMLSQVCSTFMLPTNCATFVSVINMEIHILLFVTSRYKFFV